MEDELAETKYILYVALDKGKIMWRHSNPFDLTWETGGAIVNVPTSNEDKIGYAARHLQDKAPDTLNALRKICGEEVADIVIKDENAEVINWLNESPAKEDVINRIIEWNKANPERLFTKNGADFKFEEFHMKGQDKGKRGKAGIEAALVEDDALYDLVYNKWLSLLEAKVIKN
jgi:hypothetical protein